MTRRAPTSIATVGQGYRVAVEDADLPGLTALHRPDALLQERMAAEAPLIRP